MRRRTKSFVLGLAIGMLGMFIVSGSLFYIFGYQRLTETVKHYQLLLDEYDHPETVEVLKLTRSVKRYDKVSLRDFETVKLPLSAYNEALYRADEVVDDLSINGDYVSGTLLHRNMLYSAQQLPKDLRVYEMNHLITQSTLEKGDSVDVRVSFPSGLDYIVLSKKTLIDKIVIDKETGEELCIFHLNEDEILRMSSALVDAFLHKGTYLYTTLYVSSSSQAEADVTYPTNPDVQKLISEDPNIIARATIALEEQKRQQLAESLSRLPNTSVRAVPEKVTPVKNSESEVEASTTAPNGAEVVESGGAN